MYYQIKDILQYMEDPSLQDHALRERLNRLKVPKYFLNLETNEVIKKRKNRRIRHGEAVVYKYDDLSPLLLVPKGKRMDFEEFYALISIPCDDVKIQKKIKKNIMKRGIKIRKDYMSREDAEALLRELPDSEQWLPAPRYVGISRQRIAVLVKRAGGVQQFLGIKFYPRAFVEGRGRAYAVENK